jgi:LysM repeat protein
MRQNEPSAVLIALPIIVVLLIITVIIVAALFLTDILGMGDTSALQTPMPQSRPTPSLAIAPVTTPEPLELITYHSTALGFALEYPRSWHKKEYTLEVIFSPSNRGLDPGHLQDSAIWIGIPTSDTLDHGDILRDVLTGFLPNVEILSQETRNLAAESWTSVQFSFEGQDLAGKGIGITAATNKNEVGYFIVAAAPAAQWNTIQPTFQHIINSFNFTEEAVLRPTDATPPPTPTPTPTPMIYIVQSGDTLLGIALEFGVDVDILAARNGIEVPENLRTGQKLIIPVNTR